VHPPNQASAIQDYSVAPLLILKSLQTSVARREILAVLVKSQTARHREVQWARVLLLAAEGLANIRIADQVR